MEILRTFDYLENLKKFRPKDDMLSRKFQGKWIKYSIDQYIEYSHLTAYGLLALGYGAGTKIVSLCNNRPEWNFLDMGSALAHMIHVPIYSTLSIDEYEFIINHCEAELIVIGNKNFYKRISPVFERIDHPFKVIMMDEDEEVFSFPKLYELGRENEEKFRPVVEDNKKNIDPDDVVSIIYTSGTTGTPKGVMLSHRNLTFNAHTHAIRQTKNSSHKMLSFLPLCHVYERSMNYEYQEVGISIYYAEGLSTIAADMADCHADGFCAVPRVLDMMYNKLEAAGKKLKGLNWLIYKLAWRFANRFDVYNKNPFYLWRQKIYDKLVYKKWRDAMGGKEMLVVAGGSSIRAKIVRTFNAAKLHIFEGYGMTEASPVICVNSPADGINVIGTVGVPIAGTEMILADDGEILTRGPHVMKGYYKNPEATAEAIDADGWLHTGDIGSWVDGKYLKITDRKKEIFKLSAGKYIAPQPIETSLKETKYVDNCIVVGENQKLAAAIIIPNIEKLKGYAKRHHVAYKDVDDLIANEQVYNRIKRDVDEVNSKLAPYEAIKKFRLVNDEWTAANGMLSQTLKLKRKNIIARYSSIIDEIYQNG